MSFEACINRFLANQSITEEQAKKAKDLFGSTYAQYRKLMNHAEAQKLAGQDAYKSLDYQLIESKRKKLIQARVHYDLVKDINKYKGLDGQPDIARAVEAIFVQDDLAPYANLEYQIEAVKGMAMRRMDTFLQNFRRDLIGNVRKKAQLNNVVKESFGMKTGDESASELSQAWLDSAEYLRKRANSSGASIAKLKDYGLPQMHNSLKIREFGKNEWISYVEERLDLDNMLDHKTGLPFKKTELNTEVLLADIYETIISEGFNKMDPTKTLRGSLGNRRTDHRFLKFKDPVAWLEYQEKFGTGTVFDVMMGHIDAMSRDIAVMERLGPNPRNSINFMKNLVMKDAKTASGKKVDINMKEVKANVAAKNIDTFYNIMTGNYTGVTNSPMQLSFAGLRQILQSAQLGSASIAATTDINFQRLARKFNGLPQTSILNDQLKQLSLLTGNDRRKTAIRLGIGADEWSTMAAAQARYVGDITGPEITRRIADNIMRISFLSPWTFAGKRSFAFAFLGEIAELSNKNFEQVKKANPKMAETFERYGIDSGSWDVIRATEMDEYRGVTLFDTSRLETRTDIPQHLSRKLATTVLRIINQEGQRATPSVDIRGRALLQGDSGGGTIRSEIVNSFAMYKSFSITVFNTHLMRGLKQKTKKKKSEYLADLIITTTLMGAFAIQLKEMSKGRDPRPMTDAQSWGAALLQGGGLAIFGDFLYSIKNRFGADLATTIAGPVAGFGSDFLKLTIGNLTELVTGEETKATSELIDFLNKYTPGSSLWYLRLAKERLIVDRLEEMADPDYSKKVRQKIRRLEKETGSEYWWEPGETEPDRPPDLSNVFEERD